MTTSFPLLSGCGLTTIFALLSFMSLLIVNPPFPISCGAMFCAEKQERKQKKRKNNHGGRGDIVKRGIVRASDPTRCDDKRTRKKEKPTR